MPTYVTLDQVQSWLQDTKYTLSEVDLEIEGSASDKVIGFLHQRYDVSGWVDRDTTPPLVVRLIAMLTAARMLRRAISEDDGEAFYPDWLEDRVMKMLQALVDGKISIPGVDPDPDSPLGGGPIFFPTDKATKLWQTEGDVPGAAALHFDSQRVF
jgi:hypothetical protein